MTKDDVIKKTEALCRKFIEKVDTGKARSRETYAECHDLLNSIEQERGNGAHCGYVVVHLVTGKTVKFRGRYAREKESDNWHYWQKASGRYIHFRKEHIVLIDDFDVDERGIFLHED